MSTSNGSANGAPLSPQTSYSASKSAMAAIFGPDHRYNNKDEQKKDSSAEPPSGIQGKGTTTEPYDQGNAPEAVAGAGSAPTQSSQEPLSGAQGKGTVDEPFDQGNAGEATASNQPINTTTDTPPKPDPAPTTTTTTAAPATNGANKQQSQSQSQSKPDERGRTLAPPADNARHDRSVSPGTLDDGTHEMCTGEQGKGYEAPKGLGRLANKVFGSKN